MDSVASSGGFGVGVCAGSSVSVSGSGGWFKLACWLGFSVGFSVVGMVGLSLLIGFSVGLGWLVIELADWDSALGWDGWSSLLIGVQLADWGSALGWDGWFELADWGSALGWDGWFELADWGSALGWDPCSGCTFGVCAWTSGCVPGWAVSSVTCGVSGGETV